MEEPEQRIERVLEEGLKRIETPQAAHAVVTRLERLSANRTEAEAGAAGAESTAAAPQPEAAAATLVERHAGEVQEAPSNGVAEVVAAVAEQAVAPTPAAATAASAAQAVLAPGQEVQPKARRGRRLLKEAVLRRMGLLNALDARVYLAINDAPHPGVLDSLGWIVAVLFTGGWIWVIGTLIAYLLRVPRSWQAVTRLLPSVVIATWIIEYPIKAFFRRRRPFVRIVQALVIGKKPGSWSFPSGHTGSSFASAWILSTIWPRRAAAFFSIASAVGFSRVYVGAHYPGDVASGAILGVALSETVRQVLKRLVVSR
ncbi:MAG: phosphatase PAP2 family protein [Chloroflexi bacterium]|nr:phosphatase PAP2 family protein [Chloroflexota bacterium]